MLKHSQIVDHNFRTDIRNLLYDAMGQFGDDGINCNDVVFLLQMKIGKLDNVHKLQVVFQLM